MNCRLLAVFMRFYSPIPWQWNPGLNLSVPNMNIIHSCRNFDRIHDWAKDHVVEDRFAEFVLPT